MATFELSEKDKKTLLIGGLIALAVGTLFFMLQRQTLATTQAPEEALTDAPVAAGASPADPTFYTNYNLQPLDPEPLTPATGNTAPAGSGNGNCGCGCGGTNSCFGGSQLDTGQAYTSLSQYLTYLQDTNPNYVALYAAQMQQYAALFVTGTNYSTAGQASGII